MHRLAALIFIASCASPPSSAPAACGQTCNSNIECRTGLFPQCRFCNFSRCGTSLPPVPPASDAGSSAPSVVPKGTP